MKQIVLSATVIPTSSPIESFDAALELLPASVRAHWVATDMPDAMRTSEADSVWVVPASPYRGDAAVYAAITTARTSG
jgi:hypothetical protein